MSLLRKILVVAILGIAAYCFWPREPSLRKFSPEEISDLQVLSWQQARIKNWIGHGATMYQVYARQYQIPPLTAIKLALDQTRAVQDFRSGATEEDRERAKAPLGTVYTTLKDKAGASLSHATDTAAAEFQLWQALADQSDEDAIKLQASLLAQLYGGTAAAYQPSARLFVKATRQGASQEWNAARTTLESAYKELQKNAGPPR